MKNELKQFDVLTSNGELVGRLLYLLARCGEMHLLPDGSLHGTQRSVDGGYPEAHRVMSGDDFLSAEGLYPLAFAARVSYNAGIFSINCEDVLALSPHDDAVRIEPLKLAKRVLYKLRAESYFETDAAENTYRALTRIGAVIDYGYLTYTHERNVNRRVVEIREKQRKLTQTNIHALKKKGSSEAEAVIDKINALNVALSIECDMSGYIVNLKEGAVRHTVTLEQIAEIGLRVS